MIGIVCEDLGFYAGIRAESTSHGITTDASWKCSYFFVSGWAEPGFDDSSWAVANEIVNDNLWNLVPGLSSDARWIWSGYHQENGRYMSYCRKGKTWCL